jgi:hypothetical protein
MLNIQNRGVTQTLLSENGKIHKNELDWNAMYDGKHAKVSLHSDDNGHKKHMDILLDNKDLAQLLAMPTVDTPLHKRLEMDFIRPSTLLPKTKTKKTKKLYLKTPRYREEFKIRRKSPTTRKKTHRTYRVYKK